jgi:hypothetical protein
VNAARFWLLFATIVVFVDCSLRPSQSPKRDSLIQIDGEDYDVVTCPDVNETMVPCPVGARYDQLFDGARVCKRGKWSGNPPKELCARLPRGCKPYVAPETSAPEWSQLTSKLLHDMEDEPLRIINNDAEAHMLELSGKSKNEEESPSTLPHAVVTRLKRAGFCSAMAGVTRCPNGRLCLSVELMEEARFECASHLDGKAFREALLFARADVGLERATLQIKLDLSPAPPPRCSPDDALCGPQPYSRGCLSESAYRRNGPRHALRSGRGVCEHDGDCYQDGECDSCESRFEQISSLVCENFHRFPADAYCGCVDKHCGWFTQSTHGPRN